MLLLYPCYSLHHQCPSQIYIPLCFYFILVHIMCSGRCFPIYIPLCFYFIELHLSILQATMFLIYIPLCFYFIGVSGRDLRSDCHIYIPLCFYFIRSENDKPVFRRKFTFHYASTLSITHLFLPLTILLFTFHYASTLSRCLISSARSASIIYIPLCFYFIRICRSW